MIVSEDPFKAVVFIIFLLILQQVEGNVIYPKVVGSKLGLPGMWVLAAVTVGGSLAGVLGMLLGVPAFSVLYTLINEATDWKEIQLKDQRKNAVLEESTAPESEEMAEAVGADCEMPEMETGKEK